MSGGRTTWCRKPAQKELVSVIPFESRACIHSDATPFVPMRIAATADLHFVPSGQAQLHAQLRKVREEADVLIVAGDLTNYGQPAEMEPLLNVLVRSRVPTIVVLGNHDYECGHEHELMNMLVAAGVKVLDGSAYERDGVGFAGAKGFI